MTDDLVKRLRDPFYTPSLKSHAESADRIEKLEADAEQLRSDNSSLIDSFDKDFLRQEDRIEKLEAALDDMAQYVSRADWHYFKPETLAALEAKYDAD